MFQTIVIFTQLFIRGTQLCETTIEPMNSDFSLEIKLTNSTVRERSAISSRLLLAASSRRSYSSRMSGICHLFVLHNDAFVQITFGYIQLFPAAERAKL